MRTPEPGQPVSFRLHKWDGAPHRQMMMTYVGQDEHGYWLGHLPDAKGVTLIPSDGSYLAHFKKPPSVNWIYVDITTAPDFGHGAVGWAVDAVDLDLDVVRRDDGRTWIDDEDEFAVHAESYGYPPQIVASSRATADAVLAAVREESEPFGLTWRRWIDRLSTIHIARSR